MGWRPWRWARSHRAGWARPGAAITGLGLAVLLAGCLWLALRPPRWLLPDRDARRFGVGMALVLVAGLWPASC